MIQLSRIRAFLQTAAHAAVQNIADGVQRAVTGEYDNDRFHIHTRDPAANALLQSILSALGGGTGGTTVYSRLNVTVEQSYAGTVMFSPTLVPHSFLNKRRVCVRIENIGPNAISEVRGYEVSSADAYPFEIFRAAYPIAMGTGALYVPSVRYSMDLDYAPGTAFIKNSLRVWARSTGGTTALCNIYVYAE